MECLSSKRSLEKTFLRGGGFAVVPACLLLGSLLAWVGPRALWSQSWRASTQVAAATLPTCAAAQAAGRAWAAELRAGGIDVRTSLWSAGARGERAWDFLPPAWATEAVKTYGAVAASGWDGTKRLFDVAPLARPPAMAGSSSSSSSSSAAAAAARRCVIYSFGSNLQTEFEESMLRATACDIVTFDCTVRPDAMAAKMAAAVAAFVGEGAGASAAAGAAAPAAVAAAAARFRFLPYCVGEEGRRVTMRVGGKPEAETVLRSVPAIMAELGHARVDLLKMDAEGAEHVALAEVARLGAAALPPQVSFELHTHGAQGEGLGPRFAVIAALVDAGYVLVSRDDNPVVPGCCSEVTFVLGCGGM